MSSLAASSPTVAQLFRPTDRAKGLLYDIMLVLGASWFVALCAQIAIPMPSGVPVTGQTFAVLLVGALLGSRRGAAALSVYLLQGAFGLPVFAHWTPFMPVLTSGYIIGFIPAAYVVGWLAERGWDRNVLSTAAAMTIGTAIIFLFGLAWLFSLASTAMEGAPGTNAVLAAGLWPYLPGAAIKIALAMALLPAGWKLLGRRG
jgi:biotin transport system substrate-specific component